MFTVTVLGCGASGGVPLIGCNCAVCTSGGAKNNRTRASIHLQSETTSLLIDTGPDMRQQFLREGLTRVDAIIFTHAHADHLHGIDDTRSFNHLIDSPVDIYSDAPTIERIRSSFGYVFQPPKRAELAADKGWYRPCLNPVTITPFVPFRVRDIEVLPLPQRHGGGASLGLRFGTFAYSTDVNGMEEDTLSALQGIDTWVVDCLRYEPARTHAHLEMTLGWIKRVAPKRAYLSHLNHGFDYETFASELPEGVFPAYDGLKLTVA